VAGVDEAKEELREIIDFLKDPQKSRSSAARSPRACCSSDRRAPARRCSRRRSRAKPDVPFFSIPAPTSSEMFVRRRRLARARSVQQARSTRPAYLHDEIDGRRPHRGAGLGGGHDEREQTLNQRWSRMDGFETNEGVILIAANQPARRAGSGPAAPRALRPSGRRPAARRERAREILRVHAPRIPLAPNVELRTLAPARRLLGRRPRQPRHEAALLAAPAEQEARSRCPTSRTPRQGPHGRL